MLNHKRLLVAAVAACALIGPASADNETPAPRRSCAFVDRIYNFTEVDDRTAIVQTSPSQSYRVTFFNSCREMRWAISARVEARPGICLSPGDKMIFGHRGFGFEDRCIISSVEPLPRKTNTSY